MATSNLKRFNFVLPIIVSAFLIACGNKEQGAQGANGMPAMPVSVITASAGAVPISAEAVAQTEGAKEVEVRPRVGGIINKKLFEEGQPIKAGQIMFLIDPVPFRLAVDQAQAQMAQQNARIIQTEREAKRLKSLLDTQSISQREYDNAASDNAMAKASLMQYQAMVNEAKLNLSYTQVKAPSSGIAGRFLFSEGALVDANTSLLTSIVQISPIWVRFSFSDAELAKLGGRLHANNIQDLQLIMPDGSVYQEPGKLNFSASQIDPALGTQQLRAEFANAEQKLLPGQFVRIRVTTGMRDGVYLVPQTAVLTNDQGKFLMVVDNKDNKKVVAIRPVQVGGWQGTDWVILSGLNTGDQVIVDNLIKLRPGAEINPHPFGTPPAMPTQAPTQKGGIDKATKQSTEAK
jgi:membrane fusion protein, multidrug efflux system